MFHLSAGGVFRASADGSQQALVLPGVTPAPGGGIFVGCFGATISNDGDVAFTGWVQRSGRLERGAFLAQRDGTIVRIAGNGDSAPGGGVFSSALFPSISHNGRHVAFQGTVTGVPGSGIYVRRGGGTIERIVGPGDPAAGGGATIITALGPRVNSRGDVLYAARVPRPSAAPSLSLFLAGRNRSSQAIARSGDLLPDGFRFDSLVGAFNSWTLNDSGDVAFVAHAQSAPISFFGETLVIPETGVYASSHGQLRLVAREGSLLFGIGSLMSVAPVPAPALIDARGDVVFGGALDDSFRLLVRASPDATAR